MNIQDTSTLRSTNSITSSRNETEMNDQSNNNDHCRLTNDNNESNNRDKNKCEDNTHNSLHMPASPHLHISQSEDNMAHQMSWKRKKNCPGVQSKRRKSRRLSELFNRDTSPFPSMPASPHLFKAFVFDERCSSISSPSSKTTTTIQPTKSLSFLAPSNITTATTKPKPSCNLQGNGVTDKGGTKTMRANPLTSSSNYNMPSIGDISNINNSNNGSDYIDRRKQQNDRSTCGDTTSSTSTMHPVLLYFDDQKLEQEFMREFYFGGAVYCWRITIVFLVAFVLYASLSFIRRRPTSENILIPSSPLINFFIAVHYLAASIASYAMCFFEQFRKMRSHSQQQQSQQKSQQQRLEQNHQVGHRSVQSIERLVVIILSLTFLLTIAKGDVLETNSPLDFSIYLHIWTSLSLLRPRFTFQIVLAVYVIGSWVILAASICTLRGLDPLRIDRLLVHVISLTLIMTYVLMDSYTMEKLMRYRFVSRRKEQVEHRRLELEKKKSLALLYNIFPRALIPEIKRTKLQYLMNPAEQYQCQISVPPLSDIAPLFRLYRNVSVLLSDIKNFTEFSSSHSAEDVLLILNVQFSYMDVICKKLKIEKVKTIGDAFLALGGLYAKSKAESEECLHRLLTMACGFLRIIDLLNRKYKWDFHVRIGVAFGNVIVTIFGKQFLTFDCFGEAVNDAEWLEGCARDDSVLTMRNVYDMAKDKFAFSTTRRQVSELPPVTRELYTLRTTGVNKDERITDLILDNKLHDMLDSIIEQQCKSASDVIMVKHAQCPPSIDVDSDNDGDGHDDGDSVDEIHATELSAPSIDHFYQTPVFKSDFEQLSLNTPEESPLQTVKTNPFPPPPLPLPHHPTSADSDKSGNTGKSCLVRSKHARKLQYSTTYFPRFYPLMSTYFLSHLILDCVFVLISFVLEGVAIFKESASLQLHMISTLSHLVCYGLVAFTHTFSKSYRRGVTLTVLSMVSATIRTLLFTREDYTRKELFPTALLTLLHILAVPPNVSFIFKFKVVTIVLGMCHLLMMMTTTTRMTSIVDPYPRTLLGYTYASALCGLITNYIKGRSIRVMIESKEKRAESRRSLKVEKQMNDNLILSVLLESTVERIRRGEINIFDNVSDCSVCFIKIEGMKQLIESAVAKNDDHRLRTLFSFIDLMMQTIDSCLTVNSCEKIKSANDVYMAVCGISFEVRHHTEQLLLFLFDVIDRFQSICRQNSRILGQQQLGLKIGLHSGPVSGGVLGHHRFLYDIFGDTVNSSARACFSSSRLNQVHLTEQVFRRVERVLPSYGLTFDVRGPVTLKGKGQPNMYYIRMNYHASMNDSGGTNEEMLCSMATPVVTSSVNAMSSDEKPSSPSSHVPIPNADA